MAHYFGLLGFPSSHLLSLQQQPLPIHIYMRGFKCFPDPPDGSMDTGWIAAAWYRAPNDSGHIYINMNIFVYIYIYIYICSFAPIHMHTDMCIDICIYRFIFFEEVCRKEVGYQVVGSTGLLQWLSGV